MTACLDHIVMVAADLESASCWFVAQTGVEPVYGGVHSGGATHNVLVSLGGRCYLEILAPAQQGAAHDDEWARLARAATKPSLLTYCLRVPHPLAEVARVAQTHGWKNAQVIEGGRVRPDGTSLHWQLCAPRAGSFGLAFPFFIDWLDSSHPADSLAAAHAGQGLSLESFSVGHARSAELAQVLAGLGCSIDVRCAATTGFVLTLATPRGRVVL